MVRLDRSDTQRVRAIIDQLNTFRIDRGCSAWPDVIQQTQVLLDTEQVWSYEPVPTQGGWEIAARHDARVLAAACVRFNNTLKRSPAEWAWFRPSCPEPRQRNRVVEAVTEAERTRPGFFESSHLYREFFYPLRLHRHQQMRVLLCDDSKLLRWFGALQPQKFTMRQRVLLRSLVPALRRRAITERGIASIRGLEQAIDVVLAQLPGPAMLLGPRGNVLHANPAARAVIGQPEQPPFEVIRVPRWGGNLAFVAPTREQHISHAIARRAHQWQLTPRCREVLTLVAAGHAIKTIAELLGITTRAVELHVTKLFDAAGVDSRAALIALVLVG